MVLESKVRRQSPPRETLQDPDGLGDHLSVGCEAGYSSVSGCEIKNVQSSYEPFWPVDYIEEDLY
jgi:hypothetical protein